MAPDAYHGDRAYRRRVAATRVPTEFRYWANLDRPRARGVRDLGRRLLGFDVAPPDSVVREIAAMYYDADPACEAFVDEVYLTRGSAVGRALLERALAEGVDAVADAPASLRSLFADLDRTGIDRLVRQWTAQLTGQSDLDACAASVRELSLLCTRTRDRGVGVVYTWNA